MQTEDPKIVAAVYRRIRKLESNQCFDPIDLSTRPTRGQQEILDDLGTYSYRYVTAGNQTGKSQLGSREVAWLFEDNHPSWSRPARWSDEPLLILIVGRTTKQVEEVLWRKIKGFLDEGDYKVHRTGGTIQKVSHVTNGNTLLFASHHNENEAREKLQAFVAHYVWCDEMPGSFTLFEELQRRVQSRGGYFLATFTPKVRNDEIRKMVDNATSPHAHKYQLRMFDNPVLTDDDKAKIEAELANYPEAYRNTVLYGDWSAGEEAVYSLLPSHQLGTDPARYTQGWRHVLAVDPAMSSKLGMSLWAEDPGTGIWHCILAEYVSGIVAPSEYVRAVEAKVRGYNIVKRVSDTEPWYVGAAYELGYKYDTIYNKVARKNELIKRLQTALTTGEIKIAPWCVDLVDEFMSCQWSETTEGRIVNAQRFHLLDTAQYFIDNKPRGVDRSIFKPFDQQILEAHEKRKTREARISKAGQISRKRGSRRRRPRA